MGGENVQNIRRILIGSLVMGAVLLLGAGLFLDDWRKYLDSCEIYYAGCKTFRFYVAGAALGISAALIQMGSTVLGFIGKPKIWVPIQILVAVLCVVGMALPASEKAFDETWVGSDNHSTAVYFLVWSILDAIGVLVAAAYVYKLSG